MNCQNPQHYEDLIVFGSCGTCMKAWGLGEEAEELIETNV